MILSLCINICFFQIKAAILRTATCAQVLLTAQNGVKWIEIYDCAL